jgi:hypothetical protein
MAIDTLKIANELKDAGFTTQQAETTARVFKEFAENELATKRDLKELELKIEKLHAETKLWIFGTSLALAGFMMAVPRLFAQ